MKLLIDNFDGRGAQDYTAFVDSSKSPSVVRKLNSPAELKFDLVGGGQSLAVPAIGGRVTLTLSSGNDLFTAILRRRRPISIWGGQIAGWFTGTRSSHLAT